MIGVFGSGLTEPGDVGILTGTWELTAACLREPCVTAIACDSGAICDPHVAPDRWALRIEALSGGVTEWLRQELEATRGAPADWEEMARIGVRGLRFPIYGLPTPDWSAYAGMLAEARRRDWPIHLYVEGRRLPGVLPFLLDEGLRVVIPHFGMFDRTLGPLRDPGFELLLQKADTRRIWMVFSGAYRVGYERARSAAPLLLKAYGPDRIMWGSDWPHTDTDLNRVTTYPETLKWFEESVTDPTDRQKILIDTPKALYGF